MRQPNSTPAQKRMTWPAIAVVRRAYSISSRAETGSCRRGRARSEDRARRADKIQARDKGAGAVADELERWPQSSSANAPQ